jgi:hypothetical protein
VELPKKKKIIAAAGVVAVLITAEIIKGVTGGVLALAVWLFLGRQSLRYVRSHERGGQRTLAIVGVAACGLLALDSLGNAANDLVQTQSASYKAGVNYAKDYSGVTLLLQDHVQEDGGTPRDFCEEWVGISGGAFGNESNPSEWVAGCTAEVQKLLG